MSFIHGKTTSFKVATKDISPFTKTSSMEVSADSHDVTGYGATAHRKQGGLLDGKVTAGGTYDSTASTGPRAALLALVGTTTAIVRLPEGTGTGKPSDAISGVLTKYTETSPVDDMVSWAAEWDVDGPVVTTALP